MDTDLDEARRFVENIRAHLPSSVDIMALGVKSKTPYYLLAAREALIWRALQGCRRSLARPLSALFGFSRCSSRVDPVF
jgi:hypothetical protein